MSDKTIKLTRRRAIGGLITIGGAAAAAGAGTFALFSDSETASGSLSAGTLDLSKDTSLSFTGSDIAPTDSGSDSADLSKSGSVTGNLSVEVLDVTSTEGDNPDSETNTDTSDGGELDDQLELKVWIQDSGGNNYGLTSGGSVNSSGQGSFDTAASYDGTDWGEVITDFSSGTFNVEWKFPDQGASNNDAQGDDISIDFEFTLEQDTS